MSDGVAELTGCGISTVQHSYVMRDIDLRYARILLIRLSALGDIVLTSPAIRAIRQHLPRARLTMLTDTPYRDLLSGNPNLDQVIDFQRKDKHLSTTHRLIQQLRAEKFDLVIDFQRKFRTSLIGFLCHAKARVGFHRPNGYLLTKVVPPSNLERYQHAIDSYFQLLHALDIPATNRQLELYVSDTDRLFAHTDLKQKGLLNGPLKVGLFPGASWDFKQWSPDRFVEIGQRCVELYQGRILVFGSPAEQKLADGIVEKIGKKAVSLAGELSLGQLAAFIEQCDLFISNDTGPMHMATALGVPTISLFGPGNYHKFRPLEDNHTAIRHEVPCSPCKQFNRCQSNICMQGISVEAVWQATEQKLTAFSSGSNA